jgi:hypothetical protein
MLRYARFAAGKSTKLYTALDAANDRSKIVEHVLFNKGVRI